MKRRKKRNAIWLEVAVGISFALLMAMAKVGFENTDAGKTIEHATYGFLHRSFISSADEIPVIIVDTSELQTEAVELNGKKLEVTSREALKNMIASLVRQGALGIGVDIDFSPKPDDTFVTPGDPEFFAEMLEVSNTTPVFLGVFRSSYGSSETWLGDPMFQALAADIQIPKGSPGERRFLVAGVHSPFDDKVLPGFGRALGRLLRSDPPHLPWWCHWLVHDVHDVKKMSPGVGMYIQEEYLADYSSLSRLRANVLKVSPDGAQISDISTVAGKVVVCANVTSGLFKEAFVLSGIDSQSVPGGMIHACGAMTSLQGRVMELSHTGRIAVDLFISCLLLAAYLLLIKRLRARVKKPINQAFLERFLLSIMCVCVPLAGWLLAEYCRILWTDYVIVWLTLIMHRAVHDVAHLIGSFFTHQFHDALTQTHEHAEH